MSTFYGGEQLVAFKTFNGTAIGAGNIIYTVPAGRYAKIHVNYFQASASAFAFFGDGSFNLQNQARAIICNTYTSVGSGNEADNPNGSNSINEIILQAGETVRNTIGSVIYNFTVKEYLLP